eukprot:7093209-Heterocapsa_arctica.AAC.1
MYALVTPLSRHCQGGHAHGLTHGMDAKCSGLYSAMLVEIIGKAIVNDRNSVPDSAMEIGAIGEGAPEEREGAVRVEGGAD